MHVRRALWDLSAGTAGVGVAVADIDAAVGRSRDDMRTPLNLESLHVDGHAERLSDGTWALTADGVAWIRRDEELSGA